MAIVRTQKETLDYISRTLEISEATHSKEANRAAIELIIMGLSLQVPLLIEDAVGKLTLVHGVVPSISEEDLKDLSIAETNRVLDYTLTLNIISPDATETQIGTIINAMKALSQGAKP